MTSSRLPGKVMLKANGKPMLEHLIRRLKRVTSIDEVILATTVNGTDDCLVDLSKELGIACFRGSEDDVMQRVIGAAESVAADVIVQITADCPIIDPLIVEQCVQTYLHNRVDYLSNGDVPGYPIGMASPIFTLQTLKKSARMTNEPADREHVSLHIRNHPELFRPFYLLPQSDINWGALRLCLDEKKDYDLLKEIIEYFGDRNPFFTCGEVVNLLRENPEWCRINASVQHNVFPIRNHK